MDKKQNYVWCKKTFRFHRWWTSLRLTRFSAWPLFFSEILKVKRERSEEARVFLKIPWNKIGKKIKTLLDYFPRKPSGLKWAFNLRFIRHFPKSCANSQLELLAQDDKLGPRSCLHAKRWMKSDTIELKEKYLSIPIEGSLKNPQFSLWSNRCKQTKFNHIENRCLHAECKMKTDKIKLKTLLTSELNSFDRLYPI